MTTWILAAAALAAASCARPSAVQDALDAYHVVADASSGGSVAISARAFALAGGAGASVRVTAAADPSGARAVVLERALERDGVLAWSVELRPGDGDGPGRLLRLSRISCDDARALLPELPPCPAPPAGAKSAPAAPEVREVVERVVYPAPAR